MLGVGRGVHGELLVWVVSADGVNYSSVRLFKQVSECRWNMRAQ